MRLYKFGNREIRSFRMREKTLRIKSLLNSANRTACFIMTDSIQPEDRAGLRESLAQQNLKLTAVSKKVVNLLMQHKHWGALKELLKGNVATLEAVNKKSGEFLQFNAEKLQNVLNDKNNFFSIRLFLENQKLYRSEQLQSYTKKITEGQNFKNSFVNEDLRSPLFKGAFTIENLQVKLNYNNNQK